MNRSWGVTDANGQPALERIRGLFGLSQFELDLLLLCAAVEFDSSFGPLCAAVHGEATHEHVTFALALGVLTGGHWSALSPRGPLRRWRLIEVGSGTNLTHAPLRIDERVLHYLAGVNHTDERLAPYLGEAERDADLVPSHRALAERIVAAWSSPDREEPPVVQLCGVDAAAQRAVAAAACRTLGQRLTVLDADSLPGSAAELASLVTLWEREASLSGAALLVDCGEVDGIERARPAAVRFVERTSGLVLIASRERQRLASRRMVVVDVERPGPDEQRAAWAVALGGASGPLNGQIDVLVSQFDLSTQAIHAASTEALARVDGEVDLGKTLWDSSRMQARPRLDDLAQRIEPAATWDDLVLAEAQKQILRDIAIHVRQRGRVYDQWGFASRGRRGLGISALFSGTSGTGKTMAAEVLSNELRLDLYRIDLSATVSKYIGETEKNLRRIFDAAEEGGAILLFDEADALFGKRSEVKDSHDRYANIEVGYLLQRVEAYRGLAILTTNLKNALDTAFLRRIRFVVQFPFPDVAQRREIWRRVFPAETPTEGLEVEALARLNVAGGNIRNIALNAAFVAAEEGKAVGMGHILRAAQSEYAKLEKPLTEAEAEGWRAV